MTESLISSETIVSALLLSAAASSAAAVAIPSARQLANLCKRLTPMQVVVLLTAVGIATASAQKSVTNGVDIVDGTNEVGDVSLNAPQPMFSGDAMMSGFLSASQRLLCEAKSLEQCAMGASRPTITAYDIGRGCRLDSVATNDAISYEMPNNATEVGTWRLTGAYDDVVRADLETFRFPLGTNLCSSLWAQTWGTARPRLCSVSNEIFAVGTPMSALPGVSRFWTAPTTNDTFLLTWQDFALGRIPVSTNTSSLVSRPSSLIPHPSSLVSAQLELCRNGDFVARSNNVESVYRRINPDDWDDDGWSNDEDPSPTEADEDGFGPHQDLSFIVHSNNYYWVDLVVSNVNALVTFESELPSDLPNPQFIARAGATNRVVLLLGKPYEVKCAQPIVCVETSHSDVEVMERYEGCLEISRPVVGEFVSMPLLMASPLGHGMFGLGGGGMTFSLSPEPEGYEVSLGSCCCMTQVGGGLPYFYCMGNCGCGGCSSGDITVAYDGTALTFPGYSCPCSHEPNPGGDDPQENPDGPSVSVSFSKQAVIFEDAYESEPGVTVPRRSTDVEVSYYVNGGTNGGTYAFTLVNGAKLIQVDGGTLPVTGHVAAAESKVITARYEGRSASGSEGDIIANAEFTEDETGQTLTDTHSRLTAVKAIVYSAVEAHENRNRYRKTFGIAEVVNCLCEPTVSGASWVTLGEGQFLGENLYSCPLCETNCRLRASAGNVYMDFEISVIEPHGVVCEDAAMIDYSTSKGTAGCFGMELSGIALQPRTVSFGNLYVEEIPTDDGVRTGYFADSQFSNCWSHSYAQGAGLWVGVDGNNELDIVDSVTCGAVPPPWSRGGMVWPIPMGYHVERVSLGTPPLGEIDASIRSVYTIMSSGSVILSKFNHWVSRSTNDLIVVDGVVVKGDE